MGKHVIISLEVEEQTLNSPSTSKDKNIMTQTATREITILARYALKNSDTVIYRVRNGENSEYNIGLHKSGHTTCTCKHGQNAGNFAHCYHVTGCQKAEAARSEVSED